MRKIRRCLCGGGINETRASTKGSRQWMARRRSVSALLLLLISCSALGIAAPTAGAAGTATGVINCSAPAKVTFKPPMTRSNAGSVTGDLRFMSSGTCTGGSPSPSSIKGAGKISNFSADMCDLNGASIASSIILTVRYPGQHLSMSRLRGQWGGFAVPGAWETSISGQVTGSYPSESPSIIGDFSDQNESGSCSTGIKSVTFALDLSNF